MKHAIGLVFAALAAVSISAHAAAPVKAADGVLAGTSGMTLYVSDKDVAGNGKSTCVDACAALWPPLPAAAGDTASGDYTVITRDDGRKQWAYKGKPLYFWVKDQKAGDKTGEGVAKIWHVARP